MKRSIVFAVRGLCLCSLLVMAASLAQAQAFNPMRLSGVVTAYTPADCAKGGSITIGGVTIPIGAGVYTTFVDSQQIVDFDGIIRTTPARSEVWQVLNTGRILDVYVNNGVIMFLRATSAPTNTRPFDATGKVTDAGADYFVINGIRFGLASGAVTVDANKIVRVTGTLDAANKVVVTSASNAPYQKMVVCGAPSNYVSTGGFVGDVNAFDPAGPVANFVTSYSLSNGFPISLSWACALGIEALAIDGSNAYTTSAFSAPGAILIAPGLSLRMEASKDVNSCFELFTDQFGFITNGSRELGGSGNRISGILNNYTPATTSFPTTRNETNQRGTVVISGVGYAIAANNTITVEGDPKNGDEVCLMPVIDASGQNGAVQAPGWPAPSRQFQLIKGTKLSKGACQ
ncbi:MAG: hypothetical protein U0X75_24780 [Acidobacteriota bacterium]